MRKCCGALGLRIFVTFWIQNGSETSIILLICLSPSGCESCGFSTHEMGWKGIGRRPVVLASVGLNWRGSLLSGTESLRFRGHPVLGETCLISEEAL